MWTPSGHLPTLQLDVGKEFRGREMVGYVKTMVECRVTDRVRISECSKKGKKKILELKETIGTNAGQQGFQHLGQEAGRRSKNRGEGSQKSDIGPLEDLTLLLESCLMFPCCLNDR